jgi:hypothetical protein
MEIRPLETHDPLFVKGDTAHLIRDGEREKAAMGVFITLEPATADMKEAAVSAGFYHSPDWGRDYPSFHPETPFGGVQ